MIPLAPGSYEAIGLRNTDSESVPISHSDKLFVWFFARDCQGSANCTTVPLTFPGVAQNEKFYVATRAYVEASTAIEPTPSEIIAERVFRILAPTP